MDPAPAAAAWAFASEIKKLMGVSWWLPDVCKGPDRYATGRNPGKNSPAL